MGRARGDAFFEDARPFVDEATITRVLDGLGRYAGVIAAEPVTDTLEDGTIEEHTGKIPNPVGATVEMPRSLVDDNRNVACSLRACTAAWRRFGAISSNPSRNSATWPSRTSCVSTRFDSTV